MADKTFTTSKGVPNDDACKPRHVLHGQRLFFQPKAHGCPPHIHIYPILPRAGAARSTRVYYDFPYPHYQVQISVWGEHLCTCVVLSPPPSARAGQPRAASRFDRVPAEPPGRYIFLATAATSDLCLKTSPLHLPSECR